MLLSIATRWWLSQKREEPIERQIEGADITGVYDDLANKRIYIRLKGIDSLLCVSDTFEWSWINIRNLKGWLTMSFHVLKVVRSDKKLAVYGSGRSFSIIKEEGYCRLIVPNMR